MSLIQTALRRPFTIIVAVVALGLGSFVALRQMPRDIFPTLGIPTIYVAQPYGGMDPAQMEGYLVGLSWRVGPGGLFDPGRVHSSKAKLAQKKLTAAHEAMRVTHERKQFGVGIVLEDIQAQQDSNARGRVT